MDEFVHAQKKTDRKKTSLYILISQTTKTNAEEKEERKKTEKDSLKYLTLKTKKRQSLSLMLFFV